MTDETRIQLNAKYLESVANQLELAGAKTRPTPGALTHRATRDATLLQTTDDTRLYRACVGALMYYVLDRSDAQLEVSILASYQRAPTTGAMEALRRDTVFAGNAGCESRALIQSQWNLWVTLTATLLVTPRHESHRAVVTRMLTVVH